MFHNNLISHIGTVCISLVLVLVLGTSVRCAASTMVYPKEQVQNASDFEDVLPDHDEYQYVLEAVKLGYMNGYSERVFGVDDLLTRAQFAQVLYNSYGQEFVGTNTQFKDIYRRKWYAPAVAWVNHYGIMNGCGDEIFEPNLTITREQVIKTLYNMVDQPESETDLTFLNDCNEISEYAEDAYRWALECGVAEVFEGQVFPQKEITRSELARMMCVYNEFVGEQGYKKAVYKAPNLNNMRMDELFHKKTVYEPYNNELQDYLPEQVEFTENGAIITAVDCGNKNYKSGKIETNISFRYGVFEFEFNNLNGKGYWPAIWMLPDSEKTRFPELDIYEMVGHVPNRMYGTLHHFDLNKSNQSGMFEYNSNCFEFKYGIKQFPEKTTIRLDWTKDALIWTINGKAVNQITENVPDNYMYLIMNLAIGGNWPGAPAPETQFPVEFRPTITRFEPVEYKFREN